MQTPRTEQVNADAFMTLSKIALTSIERLAALNLNATRTAFESSIAVSGKALNTKGEQEIESSMTSLPVSATNNAVAYLQGVQEIAVDTQKEVANLMTTYFASRGDGLSPTAGWLKGLELFKGYGQQIADTAESAGRRAVEVTDEVTKASRKHA